MNKDRIVDVNLTSEGKEKLELGKSLAFSYEVNWRESNVPFEDRFDKYLDASFFQHRIHWFSIFNSFMMVIFLIGLVSMVSLFVLLLLLLTVLLLVIKDPDEDSAQRLRALQ